MTAFLHAHLPDDMKIWIIPPATHKDGPELWRARRALYGLRVSPRLFQERFARGAQQCGWRRVQLDAQFFVLYDAEHKLIGLMSVHADDLMLTMPPNLIEKGWKDLEEEFKIKRTESLEPGVWVKYLGFEMRCLPEHKGVQLRIPAKYVEDTLAMLGLTQAKPAATPFPSLGDCDGLEKLAPEQATLFRTIVGRTMWMLPLRPDLGFIGKELARAVQCPVTADMMFLKRVMRYLRGTSDFALTLQFDLSQPADKLYVITDANWAAKPVARGAPLNRRSTTGGSLWYMGWLLAHWAKTQTGTTQSSCESELIALNYGCSEGKFAQQLLVECGVQCELVLLTDSAAAAQLLYKKGPGRMRHLEVKELYLQEELRAGRIQISKIPTQLNVSDLFTKVFQGPAFRSLVERIGLAPVKPSEVCVGDLDQLLLGSTFVGMLREAGTWTIPTCHGMMDLWIDPFGHVWWHCDRCGYEYWWWQFMEDEQLSDDAPVVIRSCESEGEASSSRPAVVVNVTTTAEASPSVQTGSASASSAGPTFPDIAPRVVSEPAAASSSTSAPSPAAPEPQPQAKAAGGSRYRVASPTQRQINYIGILCAKKGFDVADVFARIQSRADASAWIDANK